MSMIRLGALLLVFGLPACRRLQAASIVDIPSSPSRSSGDPRGPAPRPDLTSPPPTVAIRTGNQLVRSMSAVTGIDVTDPDVRRYYAMVAARLSSDGNALGVGSSMLLADTSLAGVFCQKLLAKEAAMASGQRKFFGAVDFTQDTTALSTSARDAVFQQLGHVFLRRQLSADEMTTMANSFDEVVSALTAAGLVGGAQTQAALLASCVGVLGNLELMSL
jgi:hypothetical protein